MRPLRVFSPVSDRRSIALSCRGPETKIPLLRVGVIWLEGRGFGNATSIAAFSSRNVEKVEFTKEDRPQQEFVALDLFAIGPVRGFYGVSHPPDLSGS